MRKRHMASFMGSAALGALLILPPNAPAQNTDSKAINDLLKEVESHAVLASDDSETLESYTRSHTMSSESHAQRLRTIADHANNLIQDFDKLSAMRSEGSPWQQDAIDRVDPLLKEMADHLNTTIAHFRDNKHRVNMPAFHDYVKANREYMSRTSKLVSSFVEYGDARARANGLEASLDLPPATEVSKE
ncbi:hypothetical protein [Occallatibacter savannae]|uniref:hypothetical protein n=1 Tax=Occallatibacter savannae TaxID=1002691 RepID=UPI0013A539EE|nr:hypothetical protein [Occallatibacter savannae]